MLYVNISTAVLSGILFVVFWRMKPCSVVSINEVEAPAYLLVMLVAITASLCSVVGYIAATVIIGVLVVGYLAFVIYRLVTSKAKSGND